MNIKNRFTGEIIYKSSKTSIKDVVEEAVVKGADLRGAYLEGAYLEGADLRGANLSCDLYILKMQPSNTVLRAWKYLNDDKSPFYDAEYMTRRVYKETDYSTDERIACDRGLNVATLQWCLKNGNSDSRFIEVEFFAKDIVAIPFATDGKFRVRRFKVLRKIDREKAENIIDKYLEPYND